MMGFGQYLYISLITVYDTITKERKLVNNQQSAVLNRLSQTSVKVAPTPDKPSRMVGFAC